jgi:hypothetical protein
VIYGGIAHGRGMMKTWAWRSVGTIMALLCALLCARPILAEAASITILSETVEYDFAESIRFRLTAHSDEEIQEVILFYRLNGSIVTGRAYPEFTPGEQIDAQWTWELVPGALAPGTEITYDWQLKDSAGQELRTEKRTFIYGDNRFTWQESSAGMVHVYTYRGDSGSELLETALSEIDDLQREIGITLEEPIHIYVYANKSDMRGVLPSRSERYDEMTTTLGMVVTEDTLLLLGNAGNLNETLAHELSHLVVGQATKNPLGGLPRWLDEGLAMYAEGELPSNNRRALERAVQRDELISVRSLSGYSGDPSQVDLFYAEAHSVVSFMLQEYGRDKMLGLLGQFQQGTYQEDALQNIYGFGLEGLDMRWRRHLGLDDRQPQPQSEQVSPQEEGTPIPCGAALLPGSLLLGLLVLGHPAVGRRNLKH